jgi:hypothetical protein
LLILIINSVLHKFYGIQPSSIPVWSTILSETPFWLMFYVTIFTVYSGISYTYKHRDIFTNNENR